MTQEFREQFIPTADGLTLYARDYPAQEPVTGLPVLCLHGLTRNSKDFEVVAPRIAALGRRVIALDVRGRGRSDRDPQPARYMPPTYAQDVLQVLERLAIPRAVFLGTSMGGLITMIVAAAAQPRVAAVILNDVGPQLNPAAVARIAGYVGKVDPVADWEAAAETIRGINAPAFPDRDMDFWRAFARRTFRDLPDGRVALDYDPAIAFPFAQPSGAAPADIGPLFAQGLGPVPTLVVRGSLSDLLTPDGVAAMRALKPDLEVAEVPGVGHAPMLDEPEAWEAIIGFLAKAE
jgi:pimeloyl-ACP methyl ester carboxylesterase